VVTSLIAGKDSLKIPIQPPFPSARDCVAIAFLLSFLRRQESSKINMFWIPAFPPEADQPLADAGMTTKKQLRHSPLRGRSLKLRFYKILLDRLF